MSRNKIIIKTSGFALWLSGGMLAFFVGMISICLAELRQYCYESLAGLCMLVVMSIVVISYIRKNQLVLSDTEFSYRFFNVGRFNPKFLNVEIANIKNIVLTNYSWLIKNEEFEKYKKYLEYYSHFRHRGMNFILVVENNEKVHVLSTSHFSSKKLKMLFDEFGKVGCEVIDLGNVMQDQWFVN